jgi:flavin reductase (DIM6/NTAB) family NADH-FMN oxidoreductase RutF
MKKSIQPQALLFPNPVIVICTYDADGKPNAATFAWGGIASSAPPAISIEVQKPRYTYDALMNRKAFTANLVPAKYAAEADYFGLVSGRNVDKFAATGLTAVRSEVVDAPYIGVPLCVGVRSHPLSRPWAAYIVHRRGERNDCGRGDAGYVGR